MSSVRELASQGAGSLAIRLGATGIGFAVSITVARQLGPSVLGTYTYAMAWVTVLATVATFGLTTASVREIAANQAKGSWELMNGMSWFARRVSCLLSLLIGSLVLLSYSVIVRYLDIGSFVALSFVVAATPLLALIRVNQQILRGTGNVLLSQGPGDLARPTLFLAGVGVCVWIGCSQRGEYVVFGAQFVALALAAAGGILLCRRVWPSECRGAGRSFERRAWLKAGMSFLAIEIVQLMNHRADILILGLYKDAVDIAIYSVAQSVAALVVFPLFAGNMVMGHRLASFHAEGRQREMSILVGHVVGMVFLCSLPLVLGCVLFGGWILGMWGDEFQGGSPVLRLLLIGQVANVFFANVALILNMTNNQRDVLLGTFLGAMVNIVLNFALIPNYGLLGAAIATSFSMIVWNVILARQTIVRVSIDPSPFGVLGRLRIVRIV